MPKNNKQNILEKMQAISELIEQGITNKDKKISTINYYKDFQFQGSSLAETDLFVAEIENTSDNTNTYEIYSGKTNKLIATVNEQGKLSFMPEYIESLKQIDERFVEMLDLEELTFKLPQELRKEDRILTREEIESINEKNAKSSMQNYSSKKEIQQQEGQAKTEETQKEQISRIKKIPTHNILMVKENSNLYKDHPNLEPNLYFYKDNEGIIRAEYIDNNGMPQPSKYFEPSSTALRQETVSLGNDGNSITKEVPYQVMKTKGLNNVDQDIRDIRINIKIDTYGYLDIEEARQGKNGEWLSHDIEVKGRDYNSQSVNTTTSIKTRQANPDKQTEAYEKVENTGLEENGIEYSEMYLIEHANEFINNLIKQGYQKPEAVQIFNYMIGEEALTLQEAKEKVNNEIEQEKDERKEKNYSETIDEERTMGGDAWERRENRRIY